MHMTEREKKVLDLINEKEVIEFAQALIRAKSDNPPGDTREAAQVCMKKFEEYGIEAEVLTPPDSEVSILWPDTDNSKVQSVIATMKGSAGPTLVMNAHIDTVRAGNLDEWKYDPFGAIIEDGYIYGRGAGDDKGAVLTQVLATCAIKKAGIPIKGTIKVNPVADEEANACRGTHWLKKEGYLKPDILIIGEQTDNKIALGERLPCQIKVHIKGKACHGAMPWNGVNATIIAADFIQLVKEELWPEAEKIKKPYFPPVTISPTRIDGGIQTNIIPENCTLSLDCRLVPEMPLKYVISRFNDLLQKLCDRGPAFEWSFSNDSILDSDGIYTEPDSSLITTMLDAVKEVTGEETDPVCYMQGSDAEQFARFGIPIAIFGPSDPSVGHSPNERVSIQQLVEGTKILAITILRLMGEEEE